MNGVGATQITLMALGTSAPEILLATVEALLTLGKPAGQLGPACIVGSAAYNFLVITAVCTAIVPTGQFKRVSELRVYITTGELWMGALAGSGRRGLVVVFWAALCGELWCFAVFGDAPSILFCRSPLYVPC